MIGNRETAIRGMVPMLTLVLVLSVVAEPPAQGETDAPLSEGPRGPGDMSQCKDPCRLEEVSQDWKEYSGKERMCVCREGDVPRVCPARDAETRDESPRLGGAGVKDGDDVQAR